MTPVRFRLRSMNASMRSPSSSALRFPRAGSELAVVDRRPRDEMDAGMPELAYVDAGTLAHRWLRRIADVTVCTSCRSSVTGERSSAAMVR